MRGSLLKHLHITVLSCLLLVPFCAASGSNHNDWNYEETHSDARDFVAGGMLHVRLTVGDVHIKRGEDSQIRLHYTVKSRRERASKSRT